MLCAVQGHGITRVVKHVFSLQKIKSWYYPHLYCLGAHTWLGSRDNVPGSSLLKIDDPETEIQVGIIQTVNFRLEKCVLQLGWFRGPVRRRTWRNVTNFIPKDAEFCTLRAPWVISFWDKNYIKIFCFLTTTLGFRQIGCHGNPQCTYENILPSDLLAYP